MKARHGNLILLLIFVTKQVTGRHSARADTSDLLEYLNISPSKSLIVVVNAKTLDQKGSNSDFNLYGPKEDGLSNDDGLEYEDEAKEQAKYLLYNYLLRTGDPQNPEDEIENDKKAALRAVLRARCQAVYECKKKCVKVKPKKYCPQNCKAVFDKLDLCDPPKKRKKDFCDEYSDECGKSSSSSREKYECDNNSYGSGECGKKGRTMPPKWRF